jgi:hypothetical protein
MANEKREISGLRWARRLDGKPSCIPSGRPRGAKAQGLRYERQLAKAFPSFSHGVWFEFEDLNGHGYCQVDFLVEFPRIVSILEVKYTWTIEGHLQLERLYEPVVRAALAKFSEGIVVCKRLVPEVIRGATVCPDFESARGVLRRPVWHWLGEAQRPRRRALARPHSFSALESR